MPLLRAAGIDDDEHDDGVLALGKKGKPVDFVAAARKHRIWERASRLCALPSKGNCREDPVIFSAICI